jgi:hypothetical protein
LKLASGAAFRSRALKAAPEASFVRRVNLKSARKLTASRECSETDDIDSGRLAGLETGSWSLFRVNQQKKRDCVSILEKKS